MSSFHNSEVLRGILESLPSGVCVIDVQRKIVLWSVGAERLTGHLRHEVIGRSCAAEPLLHDDEPGCEFCSDNCPVARAIKTSQPTEASGFLHHKAGHEVPVHIRAAPIHNEHGSIIGAVEAFEDMQQAESPDHREENLKLPGCLDEMTGVASHVLMQSHLRQCLATFVEVEVPFGVICLRLEGLQNFRSSLGPEAASALLRVVARSLRGTLWITDFVGRWSDDQFLAIVNGCREEALHSVRERVSRMVANDKIEWWGERWSLPISIGQGTVQAGDTVEALMERAQKSLDTASAWRSRSAAAASAQPSSGS